jgi:MerR family redox-sensitive transcriptional activator SoxR
MRTVQEAEEVQTHTRAYKASVSLSYAEEVRATDLLTIGELAQRSGVAPSALRYYEAQGLITATRTSGNQRRYQRAVLRRIAFIRSAQRVGLSLDEIAEALATLPGGRTPTRADWSRLSKSWRPRLD